MIGRQSSKRILQVSVALTVVLICVLIYMKNNDIEITVPEIFNQRFVKKSEVTTEKGTCEVKKTCPSDHISFYIQSGAANVVPAKICIQNNMVLGPVLNNAGIGINVAVINGKTGEVLKAAQFNTFDGDIQVFIDFLKNLQDRSIVLMASFDEPSQKLNDEARKLISDLGSSEIHKLKFRDSWVFVGGKGMKGTSQFEKYLKNDRETNKYEHWPELLDLEGCIPRYLQ